MSLIRTGVVLAIAIAMMPADKESQQKLFQASASAVQWTVTFCERNGETCTRSAELWQIFKAKAQFAAGLAYDAAMSYAATPSGDSQASMAPASYGSTLTDRDLQPVWRGNQGSKSKNGV